MRRSVIRCDCVKLFPPIELDCFRRNPQLAEYQRTMFATQFCRGDTSGRPVRLDSRKTLIELAIEAGLPPDEFNVALEADEYGRAVEVDRAQAAQLVITGVPALVIDGRYLVSAPSRQRRWR